MRQEELEKYSSAITLSDMEVFVFPELMLSLVLANIMSPVIWRWRQLDCFKKLEGKSSYKKLMRLRQFIMDEYEFNLDLETWGLTKKNIELERFKKFISPEDIARSNALFGYEGDKYYFDVDIRRHFGLDKYDSDVIPYWKTETVEAMNAFRFKPGYKKGAGECVSLAVLYVAAAYIVCGISLDDIYMILTPLHSQNFIDINDGVLTNNRRVITKTMWFNGTAISNKAQRALRNENVTIVAHPSGYIHCLYKDATIGKSVYEKFTQKLKSFLTERLTTLTLANFLRCHPEYQRFFQFCCEGCRGGDKFAKAEVLFAYEHNSPYRVADETFEKLIDEISDQDVLTYRLPDRMCCRQLVAFVEYENLDLRKPLDRKKIADYLSPFMPEPCKFTEELADFLNINPKLPSADKSYISSQPIQLTPDMDRNDVIDYLQSIRSQNQTADLAFYAYRDMKTCSWSPFTKAAIERNPISLEGTASMNIDAVYKWLQSLTDESIYEGPRLAQPDEVANYSRADGLEKAFLLVNVIKNRLPNTMVRINSDGDRVIVIADKEYHFSSQKNLQKKVTITQNNQIHEKD